MAADEILCVGEILWDSLPAGLFLGGAPFNVAGHLRALGLPGAIVSRVGDDQLGHEAIRRAARLGVPVDLIQLDRHLATGFVSVELDEAGSPHYEFLSPAAWDNIELTASVAERAAGARALVFGTLAQRSEASRTTLGSLLDYPLVKVLDLNLRPPYDDRDVVLSSLERAEVVKLNEGEMATLGRWLSLPEELRPAAEALADRFGFKAVCVTRGGCGAVLLREGRWTEHPGYRVQVVDTVGAGDAFLAGFLKGYLEGAPDHVLLEEANLLGAFVASRAGAIPPHDGETMKSIRGGGSH
ncbi:MAG TPA: carbohydrate kinase [Longimicrobiaceae bacterium]